MIPAKSLQKDTLQQITAKIKQASTTAELKRLEKSCDRLYSAGLLSLSGFRRADGLIFDSLSSCKDEQALNGDDGTC